MFMKGMTFNQRIRDKGKKLLWILLGGGLSIEPTSFATSRKSSGKDICELKYKAFCAWICLQSKLNIIFIFQI